MGLPDPRKRKPTASEVAAWARSRIGKDLMSMDIMAHNVGICPTIYSKGIGFLQQVTLLLWHGIAILRV